MSDTFWVQLFAFGGVVVVSVIAPVVMMYFRAKLRIERQFAEAREERSNVMDKVAAVHSQLEDVKRASELNLEQSALFQQRMLDSGVFEAAKLKAKERDSGFSAGDP